MKKISTLLFILFVYNQMVYSQNTEKADTLSEVVVNAFETNKELMESSAPVAVLRRSDIDRFDNSSIVNAVNLIPGLNMDERSPGSYRLNFRGSSVRSTFGVRNVTVYYNGIPLTSATGGTPLQMLGFYNFDNVEFIKGPASSMYGSGSGGIMMINDQVPENQRRVSYNFGSFNTQSILAEANISDSGRSFSIKYNRQSTDGDRDYTKMKRDALTMNWMMKKSSKQQLNATFLYSDLYYQTPGGLTLSEYQSDPESARPKSGIFESSENKNASLNIKYLLLGLNLNQKISNSISNNTVVYGAYGYTVSPTIRNYTRGSEADFGARTNFSWSKPVNNAELRADLGGEYQIGLTSINESQNIDKGNRGPLNSTNEISNSQSFGYLQFQASWENGFSVTAGGSINSFPVNYKQIYPEIINYKRSFKNQFSPRVALLKSFSKKYTVYALVSNGFSPPTISELLPTNRVFNTTLQSEKSMNYEIGARASLIEKRLFVDLSLFDMRVRNSLVQNQDSGGGTFFVNAGSAREKGIELMMNYFLLLHPIGIVDNVTLNLGGNFYNFRYKHFENLGDDFSGNKMPGTSPVKLSGSVNIGFRDDFRFAFTSLFQNKMALNDDNSEFAGGYWLLNSSIAKLFVFGKTAMRLTFGSQNILNEIFSLGNDINAVGGRYYNMAPRRSFYGGVSFTL